MAALRFRRSELGPLTPLGSGGFARVYLADNFTLPGVTGKVVYKEYKQAVIETSGPGLLTGIGAIVNHLDRTDRKQRSLIDERTVWPLASVVDDDDENSLCGILMRLIPQEFFLTVRGKPEPAEFKHLFWSAQDAKERGLTDPDVATRIAILRQTAYAFGVLHKARVVIGDVSPTNILYSLTDPRSPRVLIVDCDSLRVSGSRSPFNSQPHTPGWFPPEAIIAQRRLDAGKRGKLALTSEQVTQEKNKTKVQTTHTDVHKFALLVVRVLEYGRGKSQHRNIDRSSRILSKHLGTGPLELLQASLAEKPGDRPTMKEWYETLSGKGSVAVAAAASTPPRRPQRATNTRRAPTDPEGTSSATNPRVSGNWQEVPGKGWVRITT